MDHDRAYSQREHELVPGFLRGYRCWYWAQMGHAVMARVGPPPGALSSVAQNYLWNPYEHPGHRLTARCFRPAQDHHLSEAPKWGCGCGFYATYAGFPTDYIGSIEGSIKAEGRIIMGQRGFRAQHATIEALCFGEVGLGGILRIAIAKYLTEAFEVPFFDNRRELLEAFPPQDVSHLIGAESPAPPVPKFEYSTITNWVSNPTNVRWTLLPPTLVKKPDEDSPSG